MDGWSAGRMGREFFTFRICRPSELTHSKVCSKPVLAKPRTGTARLARALKPQPVQEIQTTRCAESGPCKSHSSPSMDPSLSCCKSVLEDNTFRLCSK